ncbi:hypothetical protein [Ornithinibacillus halophilus]|uniref:Uncharacterized protein n=1 Tax=Ornithinibacillus halophilus TaxID=930117 RepID=A0A1M5EH21_9BACI|nr:hypothetical protein [Ornithinibacillus halophilus]SHF78497.1 hypothetical protein SAMN05216225_100520 [Ornithinibacillus halophilus]
MLILNKSQMRDRKINQLLNGYTAYAESQELIRLIKREIYRKGLNVYIDETTEGCWFIPLKESKSS